MKFNIFQIDRSIPLPFNSPNLSKKVGSWDIYNLPILKERSTQDRTPALVDVNSETFNHQKAIVPQEFDLGEPLLLTKEWINSCTQHFVFSIKPTRFTRSKLTYNCKHFL